jgi:hypothetical protein
MNFAIAELRERCLPGCCWKGTKVARAPGRQRLALVFVPPLERAGLSELKIAAVELSRIPPAWNIANWMKMSVSKTQRNFHPMACNGMG